MIRTFQVIFGLLIATTSMAQTAPGKNFYDLSNRANDHFMIQFTYDNWASAPDSIRSHIDGFNRGANVYLMLDKPFKGNQRLSLGFGIGIGTSNIFFDNMKVNIESINRTLEFKETDSSGGYKKYKLTNAFLEIPLELRFSSRPDKPNKSTKFAIGIKGGTLLNVHTKSKDYKTAGGIIINNGIQKQSSKSYFNSTRLALTARFGYGVWGIFGSYSLTPIFKSGVGSQDARLWQMGLTITGL